MNEPLRLRRATLDDVPALAANSLRAYPAGRLGLAERTERIRAQKLWPLETMTVAERAGGMVGQARTIPFRGWLGGRETRVGGLAGVAVAPEARRSGVALALCREHLAQLRANGTPWSMLYPFAPSFYARLGWRPAARRARWRFSPRSLPAYGERGRVVRLSLADGPDLAAVQAAYAAHCLRVNGSLSRSDQWLRELWKDDLDFAVGVRGAAGVLDGYLLYTMSAPTNRPQALVAHEFVALDASAERALLGFLAAQIDQADWVLLDLPVDHPIGSLIEVGLPEREAPYDPEEHLPVGTVYQGLMARVVDLPGALVGRGYLNGDGALAFMASDRELPVNDAPVTLLVEGGEVRVQPGRRPGATLVRGDVGEISRVLVGGLRLWDAARMGLVEVEGDLSAADALLTLPVPYPLMVY